MSRRRRQTLSPTLFPFLAVLVCTLGTLILLLALVAQNTSETVQQIAEAAEEEELIIPDYLTAGQVQDLVEEEEFRLQELISFREAQTGDLENRRDQLAHVEDHMRRIREQLKVISDAMEAAASQEPVAAVTADQVQALKAELAEKELIVQQLREEIKTAKPRFVIVPHQGPNGTSRRPIYLECTTEGVTIWPEKVAITKWQLEHSDRNANPLDDALRAARYHALQEYGDSIPPYPMLLVRPDGVDSYYAARAAMLDWDDQFGYELVPTDVELAYPKPDPGMRQRMQYAVNQAAGRVTSQSIARSFGEAGTRSPGTASQHGNSVGGNATWTPGATGNGSGYIAEGKSGQGYTGGGTHPTPPKKVPRLSVSQMDRQGRQSGFRDHRAIPSRSYGSGSYGSGSSLTAEEAKQRLERQLEESAATLAMSGSQDASSESEQVLDQTAQSAIAGLAGSQPSISDPSGAQPAGSPMLMPPTNFAGGQQSDVPYQPGAPVGNSDDPGQVRPGKTPNMQTKNTTGAFGSSDKAAATPMEQNPQQVSQQMTAQTESDLTRAASPTRPSNSTSMNQPQPSQMVQRDSVNWALPRSVAVGQGNEIVRSVRVAVYPEQFVLLPGNRSAAPQTFPIAPRGVDQATLMMATAVREQIDRWGAAAPGARWSPRLKVDVMPGAEMRFRQLEQLMAGSGLVIQRSGYSQAEAIGSGVSQGGGIR